jgi:hypothetical protein
MKLHVAKFGAISLEMLVIALEIVALLALTWLFLRIEVWYVYKCDPNPLPQYFLGVGTILGPCMFGALALITTLFHTLARSMLRVNPLWFLYAYSLVIMASFALLFYLNRLVVGDPTLHCLN